MLQIWCLPLLFHDSRASLHQLLFGLALRGPLLHNERPGAIWLVQYNCYFVSFELQFATRYLLVLRNGSRKHQGAGHKPVSLRP